MTISPALQRANAKRADRAADTLLKSDYTEPYDTGTSDLLTDLMHLIAQHGADDFDDLLRRARNNYEAETDGDDLAEDSARIDAINDHGRLCFNWTKACERSADNTPGPALNPGCAACSSRKPLPWYCNPAGCITKDCADQNADADACPRRAPTLPDPEPGLAGPCPHCGSTRVRLWIRAACGYPLTWNAERELFIGNEGYDKVSDEGDEAEDCFCMDCGQGLPIPTTYEWE